MPVKGQCVFHVVIPTTLRTLLTPSSLPKSFAIYFQVYLLWLLFNTIEYPIGLSYFLLIFKGMTGHNNMALQSKLNSEIDLACRLCMDAHKTLHRLTTDCEATTTL